MEKYKVLKNDLLTHDSFLVEEITTRMHYVMRQRESKDETEANKVFAEMAGLLSLNHPLLVKHHDLFVYWDKNRAVSTCIVTEYLPKGDLGQLLYGQRASTQSIGEPLLKKWLGQLIEALEFIHKHHFLHKNLKSSNIFLREDLSLSIGDFGSSSRSFSPQSSLNWLAPEVTDPLNPFYDDRSDMWSLGCVMLEVATCGFLTDDEFLSNLYQLKINPHILDGVLKKVAEIYTPDLSDLLQSLLRSSYHQRPTAIELCDLPFVKSCFSTYDSSLLKELLNTGSNKQDIITMKLRKSKYSVDSLISGLQELADLIEIEGIQLKSSCVNVIIESLTHNASSPEVQCQGLHILYLIINNNQGFHSSMISLAIAALKMFPDNSTVIVPALELLMALSSLERHDNELIAVGTISLAIKIIKGFQSTSNVLVPDCILLMNLLSRRKSLLNAAVTNGIVGSLCSALQKHIDCHLFVNACMSLLCLLTESDYISIILKFMNCNLSYMESILTCYVLQDFLQLFPLQGIYFTDLNEKKQRINEDSLANLVFSKWVSDDAIIAMCNCHVPELLFIALHRYIEDVAVVKFTLATLCCLCQQREDTCFVLADSELQPRGLTVLQENLKVHSNDKDVIAQVVQLLTELTKYEDIRKELVSMNVRGTLLSCIISKGMLDKELHTTVQELIVKLVT